MKEGRRQEEKKEGKGKEVTKKVYVISLFYKSGPFGFFIIFLWTPLISTSVDH